MYQQYNLFFHSENHGGIGQHCTEWFTKAEFFRNTTEKFCLVCVCLSEYRWTKVCLCATVRWYFLLFFFFIDWVTCFFLLLFLFCLCSWVLCMVTATFWLSVVCSLITNKGDYLLGGFTLLVYVFLLFVWIVVLVIYFEWG